MPNIAKMLKDEIQRVSKHEIKSAVAGLRKDNTALKRTVADLKRRLAKLEATNRRLVSKAGEGRTEADENGVGEVKARITGKMIRSIRSRLGLPREAFARLAGVSSQAVYQWERKDGRLELRRDGKARIVAIRKLGKKEAKARLAEMTSGQ